MLKGLDSLADYEWPPVELVLDHYEACLAAGPIDDARASVGRIGHDNPRGAAPRIDKDRRKAYFVAEVRDWIANRRQRQADYMRPEEIGAAKDRPFLLLRAPLDGVAYCYREDIGADERGANFVIGVFMVLTIFSDRDVGYSTATAPRIAKLLGCSEKSVLRAQGLLVENRVLCREKR